MKPRWKYHPSKIWSKGDLLVWCPIKGTAILQIAGYESKLFSNPSEEMLG